MRPRVVAASTATLIAAAALAPPTALAAGQSSLYVNSASSACTNSGSGTLAAPFCSIQAAADAANPGDTVLISPGTYATGTVITRSGTVGAPIVFSGLTKNSTLIGSINPTSAPTLTISGASNIVVEDLTVDTGTSAGIDVDGSSNITLTADSFQQPVLANRSTDVHVTGGASAVTVSDSRLQDGVVIDGGATGTILTTNEFTGQYGTPVSLLAAVNTAITSNTIMFCAPAISVTDSSTGTSIENNAVQALQGSLCLNATSDYGIQVDASSDSTTTSDYNNVYAASQVAYKWGNYGYDTAADLYKGTGQGLHDYNGFDGTSVSEGSPIINSANSAAIGEQATDMLGDERRLDPLVTPTGAGPDDYYDRGAIQYQDPYTAVPGSSLTLSADQLPTGGTLTANATLIDTWGDTFSSYEFAFSDNGTTTTVTTSTPTADFTPTAVGSGQLILYAMASGSTTYSIVRIAQPSFEVATPQPLIPRASVWATGPLTAAAEDSGTTDAWNVTKVAFDFGDKTPVQTTTDRTSISHVYAEPGTYPVTETVTDADGQTATTTTMFTTGWPPADTLVGLNTSLPTGDTGIAQAAYTATGHHNQQIAAVTVAGDVEFSYEPSGGLWRNWQTLTQPGVTVKEVAIAGMPDGSSQLIELTSAGELLHTIRNNDTTWQTTGWGSPAGSTGFKQAAITAMPDGSTQLIAVTTAGVLMHNIRFANGTWQGWRALSQPGVTVADASIAGMPDGSTQLTEVTSAGVLKHDIRFANGSWQTQGWGSPSGSTGITRVSFTATAAGITEAEAIKADGTLETNVRNAAGSWSGWTAVSQSAPITFGDVSIGGFPGEFIQQIAVAAN